MTTYGRQLSGLLASALSVAALVGCGGDDDSNGGGITGADPKTTAPSATRPAPDAITAAQLGSCLENADVEVVGEDESYTDAEGETVTTGRVEIKGSEYVGLALWPTKHLAYVYVAPNSTAADDGEKQMGAFVKAFGGAPDEYVQRQGTVLVMLDDHDQPTPAEAKTLDGCARGEGGETSHEPSPGEQNEQLEEEEQGRATSQRALEAEVFRKLRAELRLYTETGIENSFEVKGGTCFIDSVFVVVEGARDTEYDVLYDPAGRGGVVVGSFEGTQDADCIRAVRKALDW